MLKRKLRVVKVGNHYELERKKLWWWEIASWYDHKPTRFDSIEDAEQDGIKLYSREVVKVLPKDFS